MSPSSQKKNQSNQSKEKRKAIPTRLRGRVWENHMPEAYKKMNEGPCYVCQETISILQFECGHIIAHSQGGTSTIENLVPICSSCNKSMGSKNLLDFKTEYYASTTCVSKALEPTHAPLTRVQSYNFPNFDMFSGTLPIIISQWTSLGGTGSRPVPDSGPDPASVPVKTKDKLKTKNQNTTAGCDFLLVKGQRKGEKCGHTIKSQSKKVSRCKKHLPCKQKSCLHACLQDKDYCLQHSCKRKISTKQGEMKCGMYCDNQLRLCNFHASK